MAIQTVEFRAPTGLTLTVKLFAVGGDTVLATAAASEKDVALLTYEAVFNNMPEADYMLVAFDGSDPVVSTFITLELVTGIYRPWDELDPTPEDVVVTPTSTTEEPTGTVTDCSTLPVVTPEESEHQDCPVLGKTRYVAVSKGQYATVQWPLKDRKGNTISLAACLSSSSSSSSSQSDDYSKILVRISDALDPGGPIHQIVGSVVSYEDGIISYTLPDTLTCDAGVYLAEIGIIDSNGRLIGSEKSYISVERGLFGDTTSVYGPPTIEEIRLQLRDTLIENDLLGDVEFDDVEIIHSILRPIREWNETPPDLGSVNTSQFPYHNNWLNAVVANLLLIGAHWYERNNLPSQHGGVTVQDRAKANPYLAVATQLREEWREFVVRKKVELNIELGMSDFGSDYD